MLLKPPDAADADADDDDADIILNNTTMDPSWNTSTLLVIIVENNGIAQDRTKVTYMYTHIPPYQESKLYRNLLIE